MTRNILLAVSGSIASYKSVELAKLICKAGHNLNIILSSSAEEFVSKMTFSSFFPGKVYSNDDLFNDTDPMIHINLGKYADIIIIAPATANIIAKLANGHGDCLISATCLASKAKILIAPAMNQQMWANNFVQRNINILNNNNVDVIGPAIGEQACGDFGLGRMIEPKYIVNHIDFCLAPKVLKDKKICITAGPTQEYIDSIRFISNCSSGKMGYALANIAHHMGADVTLISGPTNIDFPLNIKFISVKTADEMYNVTKDIAKDSDILISAAAVADYTPSEPFKQKIKKSSKISSINVKETTDIVANLRQEFPDLFIVGFAAETDNLLEHARSKLISKNLNMIIANDVSAGKVFYKDTNEVYILSHDNDDIFLPEDTKEKIAFSILYNISLQYSKSPTIEPINQKKLIKPTI